MKLFLCISVISVAKKILCLNLSFYKLPYLSYLCRPYAATFYRISYIGL
ncbi:hypothetical protein GALL_228380 [mine drainage metagenome]|uniref:Uncharacterized protein n=1 Tax=mine drainage metagenome TaxID=410659 RepID=A0A1J5S469_9ZZZZ